MKLTDLSQGTKDFQHAILFSHGFKGDKKINFVPF